MGEYPITDYALCRNCHQVDAHPGLQSHKNQEKVLL